MTDDDHIPDQYSSKGWSQAALARVFGFDLMFGFRKQNADHIDDPDMFFGCHAVFAPHGELPCFVVWLKDQFVLRGGVVEEQITQRTHLVIGATIFHIEAAFGHDIVQFDSALHYTDFVEFRYIALCIRKGHVVDTRPHRHIVPSHLIQRALRPAKVKKIVHKYWQILHDIKNRQDSKVSSPPACEEVYPAHCSQIFPSNESALWCLRPENSNVTVEDLKVRYHW